MRTELKVFRCTDNDWYAAKDAEHAARLLYNQTDELPEEGYPEELTDAQLDEKIPEFDEDEKPTGKMTSMRQMLAEHGNDPGWLCGSEF